MENPEAVHRESTEHNQRENGSNSHLTCSLTNPKSKGTTFQKPACQGKEARHHKSCKKHYSVGQACFPKFKTKIARLKTYRTWSKSHDIDSESLATCGFFFKGLKDKVQCFFCGGILHNWSREFLPLEEHRKLLPDCEFARMLERDPESVKEVADLPAVRAVVKFGFSLNEVEQAYDHLKKSSCTNPGSGDLLEELWAGSKYPQNNGGASFVSHFDMKMKKEDAQLPSDLTSSNLQIDGDESSNEEFEPEEIDIKLAHHKYDEVAKLSHRLEQLEETGRCKGCQTQKADSVNLPCGHIATCQKCVYKYNRCRICHTLIQGIVKVYMM